MAGLLAAVFQPLRLIKQSLQVIPSLTSGASIVQPETFSLNSIRTKVRCYFPRPNEVKRIRKHGWQTRISSPTGRRVIMRRLLKGRYVLSH